MKKSFDQLKQDLAHAEEMQKYHLKFAGRYSSLATLSQRGASVALDASIDSSVRQGEITKEQYEILQGVIVTFEEDAVKYLRMAASYSKDAYGTVSDKVRAARLALNLHIDSRDHDTDSTESPVNTNPTEVTSQEHRDTFGY